MFLVGLTGGVAAGKSSAAIIFKELGVPVVDADAIARQVEEPEEVAFLEIRNAFGADVIDPISGRLNRDTLRKIILNDSNARKLLNSITHPKIRQRMILKVIGYLFQGHQFIIVDVPLLFETSGLMVNLLHKVVVVMCERDLQLQRLMETRHLSERESILLIDAQMAQEEKAARATHVIENSGSPADLRQQVLAIHQELCSSKFQWKVRLGVGVVIGTVIGAVVVVIYKII